MLIRQAHKSTKCYEPHIRTHVHSKCYTFFFFQIVNFIAHQLFESCLSTTEETRGHPNDFKQKLLRQRGL